MQKQLKHDTLYYTLSIYNLNPVLNVFIPLISCMID